MDLEYENVSESGDIGAWLNGLQGTIGAILKTDYPNIFR